MKVSVVSPFYNEAPVLAASLELMVHHLSKLAEPWELIVVNDGSTDGGEAIARTVAARDPRIRVIGYPINQGRGYALKAGVNVARGALIVTTEIDSSWGDDIVQRIVAAFDERPDADVVIASPHLPGGGYRNVPIKRILLSSIGNFIIRRFFAAHITMNTGMTRGYRREVIQGLATDERGKEFHLEVLLKLLALDRRMVEIPAILEWKRRKLAKGDMAAAASTTRIGKTIRSHLRFAVFANPLKYFWLLSALCVVVGAGFMVNAVYRLATGAVSSVMASVGLFLWLFALLFFGFGVVTAQNQYLMREFWKRSGGSSHE